MAKLARRPIGFEENRGQSPAGVNFVARGAGYNFFLTPRGSVLALSKLSAAGEPGAGQMMPRNVPATVLSMRLAGGRSVAPVRDGKLTGRSSYFIGNDPSKWLADVPSFSRIRYPDVYPGVDLAYYGNQRELEHDFIVHPGADPAGIRLR